MDFAQLIAPVGEEHFMAEVFGRAPLHVPADGISDAPRRRLLDWERLNGLLAQRPHWTPGNIKLVMNSSPVAPEHYIDEVQTRDGPARRADPAKVHQFLGMGASLVADALEDVDPVIADAVAMLAERFAAQSGANAYCSFQGVQAFASHCDTHDVFAVQLVGEKTWRIYENRAEAPVRVLDGEGAQALIDRAKGRVMMEVRMRPGDLLYLPRGFYHDAIAASDVSLHLTFAVLPMTGLGALQLLIQQAEEDPAMRAYLPAAREGTALQDHLAALADRLRERLTSPLFHSDIEARQRARRVPAYRPNLPNRPQLHFYAASGRLGQVVRRPEGALLQHPGGEAPLGLLSTAAEWALQQRAFSSQQLGARFHWLTKDEVQQLVQLLLQVELVFPYQPEL